MIDDYKKLLEIFKESKSHDSYDRYNKDRYRFNWMYSGANIDCDYDSYRPCENGDDCCDGDYCRCKKITNAYISKFLFDDVVNFLVKEAHIKNDIFIYCLDRVLRTLSLNKESFTVEYGRGYYGEEIYGIYLEEDLSKNINKCISELSNLSDLNKIKYVLNLEYGYILDSIKDCKNVEIVDLKVSDIILNESYRKKIFKIDEYYGKDFKLPRGLYLKESLNKFRLIDGYHRLSSAQLLKLDTIKGIILH